ncbi:integrase arm-type DNA-binding domain-containing protein [Bradyrhizobium barranii subsp. apii]|uniref:tyrosine-type recombinase/integrase n=1 Tax=Bradyrhizobium barranii TaxID=2992140 RepID=UPI001AA0F9D9|nr:site-specific integrase [Bradyrhizobium barranii]UPT97830.1 integrase arm-type DNA-binding domain-containing protein [Bradyrhizobium barranii subsp. apii]
MAKRSLHKLTARQVETIAKPGRHSDGGGLYLVVKDGGSRAWAFMFKEGGRRREIGLGSAARKGGVTLAEARGKAAEARKALNEGRSPIKRRAALSFGEFADSFLHSIKAGFKGKNTLADWKRDLEVRCKPIRTKELADITANDVLAILSPLWLTINRTARETRSRIERVLDAAEAKELRSGKNPAMWKTLKPLLPKSKRSKRHHQAAPYRDIPGIVRALRDKHDAADTTVNLAAEFIILTAVRTGEARFMRVREVDFAEKLWTVPAERMKTEDDPDGTCFEVPLCDRAIAILKATIPKDAEPDVYVFAGQWSKDHTKPLGMNAVLHALKAIYPAMTTHGCRSSFRDWTGDETRFERDIAEMALAHKVGDETEQAYRRGTALKKRRQLMEAWGRYVASAPNVIALPRLTSEVA